CGRLEMAAGAGARGRARCRGPRAARLGHHRRHRLAQARRDRIAGSRGALPLAGRPRPKRRAGAFGRRDRVRESRRGAPAQGRVAGAADRHAAGGPVQSRRPPARARAAVRTPRRAGRSGVRGAAHALPRRNRADRGGRRGVVPGVPRLDAAGALIGYRGTAADVTARKQAEARIEYLATRDALTGLPNRALLTDRAGQAILTAARSRAQLAVLCVDLDRFKLVNDSLGHQAGDALLRAVADRLQNTLGREDTLARLGGDD